MEMRRFPDEEAYVRIRSDVRGRRVDIVCTLARPDPQLMSLVLAADACRDLGAASVHLIAPYLAYMRQDARFAEGEAISSVSFARLLSGAFDGVVTVDPHLHRLSSLSEIFTIPARVAHAAPLLADWIKENVSAPLILGPDSESEQWISAVAARAGAPHVAMGKRRLGDRAVELAIPDLTEWRGRTPVLVDDIVSSGRTLAAACAQLRGIGFAAPYCLVVHALFADDSYAQLSSLARAVVTTDTVPHISNAIGVAALLAEEIADVE
jgi:ribose-phosphate pyrophosphokinase